MDTVAHHEGTQFMNAFNLNDSTGSSSETSGASSDLRKRFASIIPENYNPNFSYIVVQKRISTRIMVKVMDKVDNPPPGTILDHTVTRFNFKDFFLVPQAVSQGML